MKVCICASMSAYKRFIDLKSELEKIGHEVFAPDLEFKTDNSDDTSVGHYFDTHGGIDAFPLGHDVWQKKGEAIRAHFKKIDNSDCILVANYEKKGIQNYIGGNTFLEIGYAFGQNKKIFILHEVADSSTFKEEIFGMQPTIISGDLSLIR